jgi:AcrR family transcriptional regulator
MTTHPDLAVPQPYHPEHRAAEDVDSTPRTVDWNNPRVAAILEAAAKCFSRKGFSATTLAEIGKELGLRKSIVHYYFASKAALIHEVQSYTYHKYLERVREAVRSEPGERSARGIYALWEAAGDGNVGLNIEVWSASRNDEELKRRAASLQKEKRRLVAQSIADMLGADPSRIRESLCTLVLSVLNGLTVSEYVEGDSAKSQEAFQIFVSLLLAGLQNLDNSQQQPSTPPPPSAQPASHPGHAMPAYTSSYPQAAQPDAPPPQMPQPQVTQPQMPQPQVPQPQVTQPQIPQPQIPQPAHHPVQEMPHG